MDWVKFYAVSNFAYDIETYHYGTNTDTIIDIYYERPDGTLTNLLGKLLDDRQRHIGLQKRHADFAQGFLDIVFAQTALAAQALDGTGEPVGEILKHANNSSQ